MKKSFSLSKTALAVACGSLLALSAQAQSKNDSAIVEITGQISPSTCILNMADVGGGATTSNKTVDFGNVKSDTSGITPGKVFGTSKQVVFSLGSKADPKKCSPGDNTNSGWNVILGFAPDSLFKLASGATYVKNQTKGGTDAVVALSELNGTALTRLDLKETLGYAGTTVAAKNANFTGTNTSITLQAQLAYSSNAPATAGAYTATIPLLVLYK
jgi:hypothetical protein